MYSRGFNKRNEKSSAQIAISSVHASGLSFVMLQQYVCVALRWSFIELAVRCGFIEGVCIVAMLFGLVKNVKNRTAP